MESYDSKQQLIPSIGTIKEYDIASGPGIRVDGAGKVGFKNNGLYDSLLAKVIATSDFGLSEAIRKLKFTLGMSSISGIETNKNLIIEVLNQENIGNGSVNISSIDMKIEKYLQKLKNNSQKIVIKDKPSEVPYEPQNENSLSENAIQSELVGTVISVKAALNKKIKQGDTVLIQESMKMHHPIKANISGYINRNTSF